MKRILWLILCLAMFQACDNASTTTNTTAAQAETAKQTAEEKVGPVPDPAAAKKLPPIEPAIPDSLIKGEPQPRKEVNLSEAGLDLNLKLPQGFEVRKRSQAGDFIIVADDEIFQLVVEQESKTIKDHAVQWQTKPPSNGSFRKFLIQSNEGLLVEMELDGKAIYHTDYVYQMKSGERVRLHTPFKRTFSRKQATDIFNLCRQIKGMN